MMWLCWVLGHKWFRTVRTFHHWDTAFDPVVQLEEYTERICLRCQLNQAVHVKQVAEWNYLEGEIEEETPPDWMLAPKTQHFPLREEY